MGYVQSNVWNKISLIPWHALQSYHKIWQSNAHSQINASMFFQNVLYQMDVMSSSLSNADKFVQIQPAR